MATKVKLRRSYNRKLAKSAAYTIWFGTHKEYDKINTETIKYIDNL